MQHPNNMMPCMTTAQPANLATNVEPIGNNEISSAQQHPKIMVPCMTTAQLAHQRTAVKSIGSNESCSAMQHPKIMMSCMATAQPAHLLANEKHSAGNKKSSSTMQHPNIMVPGMISLLHYGQQTQIMLILHVRLNHHQMQYSKLKTLI